MRTPQSAGNFLKLSLEKVLRLVPRDFLFRLVIISFLVFIACAIAVYYMERDSGGSINSFGKSFYWLIVTVATVGYGDFTPITMSGRIIASVLIVLAVALVPIITAKISSYTVTRRLREERGLEKIITKNHTVICGWNEHIDTVVDGVVSRQEHAEIVLVNLSPVERMSELVLRYKVIKLKFVHGDFTSEAFLDLANVRQAASVIILTDTAQGNISSADERAVLATLTVKTMNPRARVCVEVTESKAAPHVRRAGATEVVVHGEHDPYLITSAVMAEGIVLAARQLLSYKEKGSLQQRAIPGEYTGKKFKELSDYFREKQSTILIGLCCMGKALAVEDVLSSDYSLIDEFIERKFKEAGKEYLSSQFEVPQANLNPGDDYVIKQNEVAIVVGK